MGLARPYIDRKHFKDWNREKLIDVLIETKTRLMEAEAASARASEREPWYTNGQPMPYVPADGQW